MPIYVDEEKCTGCGACISACSNQALSLENNRAVLDQEKCTECLQCMKECPESAFYQVLEQVPSVQKDESTSPAVQSESYPSSPAQSEDKIQKALYIGENLIRGIKSVMDFFGSESRVSRREAGMGRGRGRGIQKRRRRGRK